MPLVYNIGTRGVCDLAGNWAEVPSCSSAKAPGGLKDPFEGILPALGFGLGAFWCSIWGLLQMAVYVFASVQLPKKQVRKPCVVLSKSTNRVVTRVNNVTNIHSVRMLEVEFAGQGPLEGPTACSQEGFLRISIPAGAVEQASYDQLVAGGAGPEVYEITYPQAKGNRKIRVSFRPASAYSTGYFLAYCGVALFFGPVLTLGLGLGLGFSGTIDMTVLSVLAGAILCVALQVLFYYLIKVPAGSVMPSAMMLAMNNFQTTNSYQWSVQRSNILASDSPSAAGGGIDNVAVEMNRLG